MNLGGRILKPRVLVIDDDSCFVEAVRTLVQKLGGRLWSASSAATGYGLFSQTDRPFDLVVIDYHLPDMKGAELAEILKRKNPGQQITFATGDLSSDTLSALLKTGSSSSFLSKGDSPEVMLRELEKGIQAYRRGKRILETAPDEADLTEIECALSSAGFVGRSKAMFEVVQKAQLYRSVEVDVLILGETGVGKELAAKALLRPGQKLFTLNCAAFSESSALLESELFGHARGSFTDAKIDKPGLFEVAAGHVVFLDEIHALSKAAQGKLLRFLQEKKIRRVGENFERDLTGKFRIVCAAKPNLKKMAEAGEFLPDLFYRISKAEIHISPLRDRLEDLEPLVLHFSTLYGKRFGGRRRFFESSVIREMEKCSWPGNVRDLENTIAALVLESSAELITGADFVTFLGKKEGPNLEQKSEELPLDLAKRAFEKQKILSALRESRTVTEAAQRLNVARTTLTSRLSRFEIHAERHFLNSKTREEVC